MKGKLFKGTLVGLGALVLSTLGIFASDVMQGIDSGIGNLASLSGSEMCPKGMEAFKGPNGLLCVDVYEATAGDTCPNQNPKSVLESEKNAGTQSCYAASVPNKDPWTFISLTQAQRMCAASNKRLPTSDEWYALALGTREETCMVKGDAPRKTGSAECVSSAGVHDMVGNVWEWVNETVEGTQYRGRQLPGEGYVHEADASGIAIHTDPDTESELYGKDYFWSKAEGTFGMIRGGFYGGGEDAGLYATNASMPTNFATQGVGFRCVSDVI